MEIFAQPGNILGNFAQLTISEFKKFDVSKTFLQSSYLIICYSVEESVPLNKKILLGNKWKY